MDDLTVEMTLQVNVRNATSLAALNAALNCNDEALEYCSKEAVNAIAVCLEGLAKTLDASDIERLEKQIQLMKLNW